MSSISHILHDPADAFCALYDSEAANGIMSSVASWREEPGFNRFVEIVRTQAVSGEYRLKGQPAGPREDNWSLDKRTAAHLYGLDAALMEAHPGRADVLGLSESLMRVSERYRMSASFCSASVAGALVPRFAQPLDGPADHLDELFGSVMRLTPAVLAAVRICVPADPGAPSAFRAWEPSMGLRVACAGFVATPEDLEWRTYRRGRHACFTVSVREIPPVEARIPRVLDALDQSGAQIGVLPESVLSPRLLELWRSAIQSRGKGSELRLLMPGTGNLLQCDPPSNIAILLDGQTGEEVLRARKRHRFRLTAASRSLYALEGEDEAPVSEDLDGGEEHEPLVVLDLPMGRLGMLICEDLAAVEHFAAPLASVGTSMLLVPVLSRPPGDSYRWEHRRAEAYTARPGGTVVVSNSPAVALRLNMPMPVNTATVVNPYGTQLASTAGGEELAVFDLMPGTAPQLCDVSGRSGIAAIDE